ncbi:hypothetical protein QA639_13590 [Bradyrhizobium pachyrhizi]|uniref:hypothetical protein n=1 Tax=Bradyrhizobium pachyrhizi TaxID=280333 RepID=UPI0024B0949C|nr:hypothetical protein [Bradyrhizobium pachyrhizi]WFU60168.1 hypothetical protein QA639_13590 [Bradyrhizobium pachyrhizi]
MQLATHVLVSSNLFETLTQDGTLAPPKLFERSDFAGRHILGEVLQNRHILAQEIPGRRERFAIGV